MSGHVAPPATQRAEAFVQALARRRINRRLPVGMRGPMPQLRMQLAPIFVEWMMGLPAGHVTGAGLSRNDQLKALGNGVVPQQAELAVRLLLERERVAA